MGKVRITNNETGQVNEWDEADVNSLPDDIKSGIMEGITSRKLTYTRVPAPGPTNPISLKAEAVRGMYSDKNFGERYEAGDYSNILNGLITAVPGFLTGGVPGALAGGVAGALFPPKDAASAATQAVSMFVPGVPGMKFGKNFLPNVARGAAATQGLNAVGAATSNFIQGAGKGGKEQPLFLDPTESMESGAKLAVGSLLPAGIGKYMQKSLARSPVVQGQNMIDEFLAGAKKVTEFKLSDWAPSLAKVPGFVNSPLNIKIGSNTKLGALGTGVVSPRQALEHSANTYAKLNQQADLAQSKIDALGEELGAMELALQDPDLVSTAAQKFALVRRIVRHKDSITKAIEQKNTFISEGARHGAVLHSLAQADAELAQTANEAKRVLDGQQDYSKKLVGTYQEDLVKLDAQKAKLQGSIRQGKTFETLIQPELNELENRRTEIMADIIRARTNSPEAREAVKKTLAQSLRGLDENKRRAASSQTAKEEARFATGAMQEAMDFETGKLNSAVAGRKHQIKSEVTSLTDVVKHLQSEDAAGIGGLPAPLRKILAESGTSNPDTLAFRLRDTLFSGDTETFLAYQNYLKANNLSGALPKLREDMLTQLFDKGYDPVAKFPANLQSTVDKFGREKLSAIFSKEELTKFTEMLGAIESAKQPPLGSLNRYALYAGTSALLATPALALFNVGPSAPLAAKAVGAGGIVLAGVAWPKLLNALIRDSKLGDNFKRWAEMGASRDALRSVPYLLEWIKTNGYDYTEAGLNKWGPTKKPQPPAPAPAPTGGAPQAQASPPAAAPGATQ